MSRDEWYKDEISIVVDDNNGRDKVVIDVMQVIHNVLCFDCRCQFAIVSDGGMELGNGYVSDSELYPNGRSLC